MPPATICLALTVLASLTLRLVFALGPLENLDGYAIPDDAYLFLDLARSIAHGDGPLYGREHTNGFQPLFAFLLAPVFWFADGGDGPVHAALVLLVLFDTATLVLLLRLVGRLAAHPGPTRLVVAGAWLCHPLVLRNTLNGMETAVALFFGIVALGAHRTLLTEARCAWSPLRAFAAGATIGVAMLARVDSILLVPAFAAWIAWRAARGQLAVERPAATLALWAAGAAAAFAPWIAYSGWYTGDFYPVSGRAVRFQADAHFAMFPGIGDPTWTHLRRAGGEIYRGNFVVLVAVALVAVACAVRPAARREAVERGRLLWPLAVHAVLLYVAYTTWIHGTWFFHRYLHPILVPCLLALAVGVDAAVSSLSGRTRWTLATLGAAVLVLASTLTREFDSVAGRGRDGNFGYRAIGVWTRDRFAPGTVIGAKQSGAIGYYAADCTVLNLDGVVNRAAFEALTEHRMLEYLATQDIDWFVMWEYGEQFLRRFSSPGSPHELVRVETVPDIHSWGDPGENAFHVYRLD